LVSGAVTQAVSMLVHGGGKMDWVSVAADAFGNVLGNSLTLELSRVERQPEPLAEARSEANAYSDFDIDDLEAKLTKSMLEADPRHYAEAGSGFSEDALGNL
jgi:hypothetical protein